MNMSVFKWRHIYWPQGSYAARMIVAALASYSLAHLLGFPQAYSAVISALIVVRPYQEGAIKAGITRLLVTCLGLGVAYVCLYLHKAGLNDYVTLLLAIAPFSVMTAYNLDYRIAMFSAMILLASYSLDVGKDIALGRTLIVALGAVVGIMVSVIVLPVPHKHAIGARSLKILDLLADQLGSCLRLGLNDKPNGKADVTLRRHLLDLTQTIRDHSPANLDEDASHRMVGLTRHIQSLCQILRVYWRNTHMSEAQNQARLDIVAKLSLCMAEMKPGRQGWPKEKLDITALASAISQLQTLDTPSTEPVPEAWILKNIVSDLENLSGLMRD